MATTTTHVGVMPADTWTETVEGATPNSIEISLNAKGQAQFAVKLTYATPDDIHLTIADQLNAIIEQVKLALAPHGIALAGAPTTSEGR